VKYVSKLANSVTRTFRVDVWFANPDGRVPAGQTAEVTLGTGRHLAHRVRKSALTLDDKGVLGVKTLDGENRVTFRKVSIIDDTPDGVWIEGLPASARVITLGQEFVVDGQKVQPSSEPAPAQSSGSGG
ncbi:MAG: efflux RND transporter periplasmic adaptor subunit, partial [Proteobacteria bacterium]|nr:efflux RND transporter periplasmic adaptor subunit [Pseudomonadota bacterium]